MRKSCDDWGFGADFPFGRGFRAWAGGPRGRRRTQMFESGEMKFVILRLIREKPRHGYEVMKALEEKFRGPYTPSAGSVYPTLQLLEDEGFVRVVETEGKKAGKFGPANPAVMDKLIEAGTLLARGRVEHSYPHSWRSKAPVIFRNTPQWFIRMDQPLDDPAVVLLRVEPDNESVEVDLLLDLCNERISHDAHRITPARCGRPRQPAS